MFKNFKVYALIFLPRKIEFKVYIRHPVNENYFINEFHTLCNAYILTYVYIYTRKFNTI